MTQPAVRAGGTFSARTRILAWILLVTALASAVTVLVTGRVLFSMVNGRATTELSHEADKFHAFAAAGDPATGEAFASPDTLLASYLSNSIPDASETLFSIVNGAPQLRSRGTPPLRLDVDPAFVAKASAAASPTHGTLSTTVGTVKFAILPVQSTGTSQQAALVVIEFLKPAEDRAWATLGVMSVISVFSLLLAGVTGWVVAGRVLAPIRDVRETAEQISETDLSLRIVVRGNDDVAQLATTFNRMLDRIQGAFDGQKQFLDDVGHELRTPITIVRGHLEVMEDDPSERDETLRLVDDELKRMSRLVDDLILLARSERPDFITPGPVVLADLVMDSLSKASALADREWRVAELPDGSITADNQRLAQALLQLSANAVNHTEVGDTIEIGAVMDDDSARLWVSDTGAGIPPEDQETIFLRLDRGSAPSSLPGAGLGLAIVSRIVQAHHGTVGVESELGTGSTFTISLPRDPSDSRVTA